MCIPMIEKLHQSDKNIPEILDQISPDELFELSQESYHSPELVQTLVLKQILEWSKNTEFGRKHGFGEIKTIDDFQRLVPVAEWADVEPFSDRIADGEEDVLIPGKPKVFIATTGTSANKPKLFPESEKGAMVRNAVTQLRLIIINRLFPGILKRGCIFPLANYSSGMKTPTGISIERASITTLDQSLAGGQSFKVAFPMVIMTIVDPALRDYLLMRFAIQHNDVVLIAGNNAGRIKELAILANIYADHIISDIDKGTIDGLGKNDPIVASKLKPFLFPDPARAAELRNYLKQKGELLPKDYWPSIELMAFWLSASVGNYITAAKPIMPETTKYMDMGYGASEGKFNIPFEPDNSAGSLSIMTAFYEFIPVEGGMPILAHQLEDQKCYELVITTWSGLYRYNMKDVIKVEGFTGKTPNIEFQYKSYETLNCVNEKIPAILVDKAIRKIAKPMGIDLLQIQIFPDENERNYICYLEPIFEISDFDATRIEKELHKYLVETNELYNRYAVQLKQLNVPNVVEMKQGWQNHLYETKTGLGQSTSQVKLPILINQKAESDWIK
jgi:hypothetical protein